MRRAYRPKKLYMSYLSQTWVNFLVLVAPNCSDMFASVECFLGLLTSVDVKLKVTSIVHLYQEV